MEHRMLRRSFLAHGLAALGGSALTAPSARAQNAMLPGSINIVSTSGTTNLVLTALLQRLGYLRELGVNAKFTNVADGNKVVAALISGDMDLCPTSGFTQVLSAIDRGAALRIIAGGAIKNFNALFSGNPQVRKLKDLEGRTVGIGALGSQLHQTMIALFRKYGVDASKVRFANVGASTDVLRAVIARVIDAGAAEVWLQGNTGVHILENGKTFESLPEFVNQAAFTTQRAINSKRMLLVRTLAAYARMYRYIMSGDSAADFVAASNVALGKNDVAAAQAQWRFYREIQPFAADLQLSAERLQFMQELNLSTGSQRRLLPFEAVTDMSLAREALTLLR
jgi:ABC-type nitrate/sulfonate/bicarbonate transport system substrate-binding protein